MKKVRLSTLQLVVVILALSFALLIQHRQAVRREARLRLAAGQWEADASGCEAKYKDAVSKLQEAIKDLREELDRQQRRN